MTKLLLTSTLCAILAFSSCSKSDDSSSGGSGSTKTRTEYLTASPWKQVGITVSPGISVGGTTLTDLWPLMPACMKDDTRKFNTDKSGFEDAGATKCDPADAQTTQFTWSLISGESKLVTFMDGTYDTTNIQSIDANTFKAIQTVDGSEIGGTAGSPYTLTITATH